MTDYTKLVEDLHDIEKTMFALGTSPINMDKISMYYAYNKGWGRTAKDSADAIEALQAKVTRLQKEVEFSESSYDELSMQADIQNALLAQQLPKRGEWVEDTTTYAGPGLSNYKCSLCGKICGTWRRGLEPSELPNWCGNCGADMRAKMEVQE